MSWDWSGSLHHNKIHDGRRMGNETQNSASEIMQYQLFWGWSDTFEMPANSLTVLLRTPEAELFLLQYVIDHC